MGTRSMQRLPRSSFLRTCTQCKLPKPGSISRKAKQGEQDQYRMVHQARNRDHHHGPEMIGRLLAAEPSLCNREIGERLGVAERTVKGYVRQLKARLGIPPNHSRSRLILRLTAGQ